MWPPVPKQLGCDFLSIRLELRFQEESQETGGKQHFYGLHYQFQLPSVSWISGPELSR